MDLYPEIRVDLLLKDDQIDISMRAADVAIWTREPEQSDLIRRPLFTAMVRPMASTKYTRRFGTPETLADLDSGITASSPTAASRPSSCPPSAGSRPSAATAATRAFRPSAPTASSPSSMRSAPASASA